MTDLIGYAPWVVLLFIFVGMAILLWRSLSNQHELDKLLAQLIGQLTQPPLNPPVAAPIRDVLPTQPKPLPKIETPERLPPQVPSLVVDKGLVDFIKHTENFSPKAYWDYKQYSIGYGTKATSPHEVIDEAEAEKRLALEVDKAAKSVEAFAPNAPKGVKQALTDLTYNAGPGWEQMGLGQFVKAGNYEQAKARLLMYNHANGQILDGLTKRREAEVSWFDNPL